MFAVVWDAKTNGVILKEVSNDGSSVSPAPRPVFYQELDLLGFSEYWNYPKTKHPLLWSSGRRYFYMGKVVAEANGGSVYEKPEISLTDDGKDLVLEPIDIDSVIKKNSEKLFILENEAMDFIEHTYRAYKNKKYVFAIAYSGGKDSQVVLDLVTRTIPPDEIVVVFSDTTMEIPHTYETVEKTKKEYEKKYPGLKFFSARPIKPAAEFWEEFGPPSRLHRWCCTVSKTVPFHKSMLSIFGGKKNRILVFDGVRSEESSRRREYSRLSTNTKHSLQANAEVIKFWNSTEVFLYMYLRNLYINDGYRFGLKRVGCSICPFASRWSEYILSEIDGDMVSRYLSILTKHAERLGIKEDSKIKKYISEGQWKKRAGGEGFLDEDSGINLISKEGSLTGVLKNPKENFLEWIKIVGDVFYKETGRSIEGEIRIKNEVHRFQLTEDGKKKVITIDTHGDVILENKLKRVLYKTQFCVHCGACEVECPTAALQVIPKVKIDVNICTHCGNCATFVERGCLLAKSAQMAEGGRSMNGPNRNKKLAGFGRYLTFGMRDSWLQGYFSDPEGWFEQNNLGNKQESSMKVWLQDAELLSSKKMPTDLTYILKDIYFHSKNFVWEILWTNLYYHSNLCKFFVDNVEWKTRLSKYELVEYAKNIDETLSERTIGGGINSLLNLFSNSPLGTDLSIGVVTKEGKDRYVHKIGSDGVYPLSVAYSLYKLAESGMGSYFTISDLYSENVSGGPYKMFGISREYLIPILRTLQEDRERILKIELISDLENIYLREDLTSKDILNIAKEVIL